MIRNYIAMQVRVVTAFLRNGQRILILKRSEKVGSYKGRWAGISGFIEENETPLEAARREVLEETRIKEIDFIKQGQAISVLDEEREINWIVHPFLFNTKEQPQLDWEHETFKWILPTEITNYKTVPGLKESLEKVLK